MSPQPPPRQAHVSHSNHAQPAYQCVPRLVEGLSSQTCRCPRRCLVPGTGWRSRTPAATAPTGRSTRCMRIDAPVDPPARRPPAPDYGRFIHVWAAPAAAPRRATPRHARRLPRSVAITTDYGNGYRTPPISSTQRSTPRVTATCSSWATAASARGSTRCRKRTSRSGPGSASSSDRPVRVDQAARPSSHFCHASVSVEGSRSSK
jgi:hypothetical protein